MLEIIGLRVLYRVKEITKQTRFCGFEIVPEVREQYEIVMRSPTNGRWKLSLSEISGECGSGYTTASWAEFNFKEEENNSPFTHLPNKKMLVNLDPTKVLPSDFKCMYDNFILFEWVYEGCVYYPDGGVSVNTDLFHSSGRGHTKPVIWVFTGPSNQGKTTIASALSDNLEVYETDVDEDLCKIFDGDSVPKIVYAQIIVLGNKYQHTLEDIKEVFTRYKLDVDIIPVQF